MRIKNFFDFIDEAISMSDARKAAKIFLDSGGKKRYDEIFKGSDRLYYNFSKKSIVKSPTEIKVSEALQKNGYYLADYEKGLATKEGDNKNVFKVQKLLVRFGFLDLKNEMDADPIRFSAKKDLKKVVISRHGIDIAGQSTGRDWTSCKNIDSGHNGHYVWTEIEQGSLVAYLIKSDDLNIQEPISRILIGVYVNDKDSSDFVLYPDANSYGNYKKDDFMEFVKQWCDDTNSKVSKNYNGIYKLSQKCYADNRQDINIMKSDKMTLDQILAISNSNEYNVRNIIGKKDSKILADNIKDLIRFINSNKLDEFRIKGLIGTVRKYSTPEDYLGYINLNSINDIIEDLKSNSKTFFVYIKGIENLSAIEREKAKKIKVEIIKLFSEDNDIEEGRRILEYTLNNMSLSEEVKKYMEWVLKD